MIVQARCDNSALVYNLGLATLFLGLPRVKCLFLAELTEQTDMDHFLYTTGTHKVTNIGTAENKIRK